MQQHAIHWIEIPVSDFDRAKQFYSKIFNYEMPEIMMGPQRMGFFIFDQQNKGIGAAIVHGEGYTPSSYGAKVYLNGGENLSDVLDLVTEAGGKIVSIKQQITPELGYYAEFEDTEGNQICLHSIN